MIADFFHEKKGKIKFASKIETRFKTAEEWQADTFHLNEAVTDFSAKVLELLSN